MQNADETEQLIFQDGSTTDKVKTVTGFLHGYPVSEEYDTFPAVYVFQNRGRYQPDFGIIEPQFKVSASPTEVCYPI